MPVTHQEFLEDGLTKLEKTSKQTQDFVLHFIVFACLGEGEARADGLHGVHLEARKNKQA